MRKPRSLCTNRPTAGFTLLEILAALAVLSVASFILISMYASTIVLSQSNRDQVSAARLAEEVLVLVQRAPAYFEWPDADEWEPGDFHELTWREDDPDAAFEKLPATMPTDRRAYERERAAYERFAWRAFAERPGAAHAAITVVVSWETRGHTQHFTLTGAAPWASVEDQS